MIKDSSVTLTLSLIHPHQGYQGYQGYQGIRVSVSGASIVFNQMPDATNLNQDRHRTPNPVIMC